MANGTSFVGVEPWPEADACASRILSNSWIIGVNRLKATWWGGDKWPSRTCSCASLEPCGELCPARRCSRVESVSDEVEGKADGERRDKMVSTAALS